MSTIKKILLGLRSLIEFPEDETDDAPVAITEPEVADESAASGMPVEKNGISKGNFEFDGSSDDDLLAVILAVICDYTELPMTEIRIKSIKAI